LGGDISAPSGKVSKVKKAGRSLEKHVNGLRWKDQERRERFLRKKKGKRGKINLSKREKAACFPTKGSYYRQARKKSIKRNIAGWKKRKTVDVWRRKKPPGETRISEAGLLYNHHRAGMLGRKGGLKKGKSASG